MIADEAAVGIVGREFLIFVFGDAFAFGAYPYVAPFIAGDAGDVVAYESVVGGVVDEFFTVKFTYPSSYCAYPEVAVAVLVEAFYL